MDLEIISCFVAEHLRAEQGNKYTAIGMPMIWGVKEPEKPVPAIPLYMHVQAADAGEAEVIVVIRDPKQKKTVYSRSTKVKTPAKSPEMEKDPHSFFNMMHPAPLENVTFGHPGIFEVGILVDKAVKKRFKILVAVPQEKTPPTR